MTEPTRAVALYGTDEVVAPPQILSAGPLTAELEAGNLRYIRWKGEEVLRAVSFIVRDKDWGTYNPEISDLKITEDADGFTVTLNARAVDATTGTSFAYKAKIDGFASGKLVFHGRGTTETGFLTNRTGFVILHPIDGVAGAPVTIEHTGGEIRESTFPEIIDPIQPMMDLRALTHHTPGGLKVRTLMEGDTYEMEDQRNWTDASYKTYVRPLALPWPYEIPASEVIDQTITVQISGETRFDAKPNIIEVSAGPAQGKMPPLGLGLRPEDTVMAMASVDALRTLNPSYLVLHHDPRAGHDQTSLQAMLDVAQAVGAQPWLELVVASTTDSDATTEVAAVGQICRALGAPFDTVLVSPAPDMKCTLPGSVWPQTPDAATLYDATRMAFPRARIGGGMFSYFTELNRKRPPAGSLDLVSFTTSPMVHAGDDRSVMESQEAHPSIIKSVIQIASGKPWAVGPSAIGMRDNPYGETAKDNPDNIRQAMNWNDPRQRGVMGAAWSLGYVADFALGGAASIAMGGCTGPHGVVTSESAYPQPWFDENAGVFPLFHPLRGLAALNGHAIHPLDLSDAGAISGIATKKEGATVFWIANLRAEPVTIRIVDGSEVALAVLSAQSFAAAAAMPDFMDKLTPHDSIITLDGFAVLHIKAKE